MKKFIFICVILAGLFFLFKDCNAQTINVKKYPGAIELNWDIDSTVVPAEYLIFYCQAADSNDIVIHTGDSYENIYMWWIGSALYRYYFIKVKGEVYPAAWCRIGVITLGLDGQFSTLKCIPKCLKIIKPPTPGKVEVK